MVKYIASLLLTLVLLCAGVSYGKEYVVRKVIDGDTIQIETGETVRYLGIDSPELSTKTGAAEFYSREAARYNKKLVFLKKVRLEFDVEKKDHYGRLLAYVYVKNVFINAELVRLGYARVMVKPPNLKHQDMLVNYQKKAMEEERGLWQEKKKDTEASYVGNKRTYTLHRPSCAYAAKIPEKGRIIFRSRVDAIKIGYSPCRKCKP
jgi:micrococcal nuclease